MYKGYPIANKVLQKIDIEEKLEKHRQNLKNMRPTTELLQTREKFMTLKTKKKDLLRQTKFTEIQRQNRLLLQKINTVTLSKGRNNSDTQITRSLNSSLRKKQCQTIQVQNAQMLKRLKEKKSDYEFGKYKKQWSKTKRMIKSISTQPIVINHITQRSKVKPREQRGSLKTVKQAKNGENYEIIKLRLIGNTKIIVTIRFTAEKLTIIGDLRSKKQLKIIELSREQALQFIQRECEGDINGLFDCLDFDEKDESLLLISQQQNNRAKTPSEKYSKYKIRQRIRNSKRPLIQEIDANILQRQQLIF